MYFYPTQVVRGKSLCYIYSFMKFRFIRLQLHQFYQQTHLSALLCPNIFRTMATAAADVYERTDQSIDSRLIDTAVNEVKSSKPGPDFKLEWTPSCADILDKYYSDLHSKVYSIHPFPAKLIAHFVL
jgi:hypothetical protein